MYTEEEACKLWCPMVRFVIGPETSKWQGVAYTNRCQELNTDKVNCITSSCMMWRWDDPLMKRKSDGHICYKNPTFQYSSELEEMTPTGFCGLARR